MQGRLEEAQTLTRKPNSSPRRTTLTRKCSGGWHVRRCWRSTGAADAEALASEAVRLAEPTDDVVNNVNANSCLAWILRLRGQNSRAGQLLKHARALALAKGSSVMAARLDELEAEPAQRSLKTSASA